MTRKRPSPAQQARDEAFRAWLRCEEAKTQPATDEPEPPEAA